MQISSAGAASPSSDLDRIRSCSQPDQPLLCAVVQARLDAPSRRCEVPRIVPTYWAFNHFAD